MSKQTFKISAALKDLIGRELITDEFVAVFELVKNSYDANAKLVKIVFENNRDSQNTRLLIIDDGKGMNFIELKNKWLFVAYSAKKLGKENEDYRDKLDFHRSFAGAKGVGRFSCDRLGKHLRLITKKDEKKSKLEELIVDWVDFEGVDDKQFANIEVKHSTLLNNEYELEHGTVLEISGLRDNWNRDRILKLKKSLVKLINPEKDNSSDQFEISIIAKDELKKDKEIQSNILNKKNHFSNIVNGFIKNIVFEALEIKTTNVLVQISPCGEYIETTLQDRGDIIFHLKEVNPYTELRNINVYLFQLNRSAKLTFTRLMGIPSVEYGSVFVYKNGFRIYPYGEVGEDLLLIDRRKQQGYNRYLGTRDLIGRIEIIGEQPNLRETTSRDGGLFKTNAYNQLVVFFRTKVLARLENYVVNIIKWGDERIEKDQNGYIISKNPELWPVDVKIDILEMITGFIKSKDVIDISYDDNFLNIIENKKTNSIDKSIRRIESIANKSKNREVIKEARKIKKAFESVINDQKKAIDKADNAEKELLKSKRELEYITSQNIFLTNNISDNSISLQSILHHIGLTTNWLRLDIKKLIKAVDEDKGKGEILRIVKRMSYQNEKITSFSKYFKKINYDYHSKKMKADLIIFINEYIENVYKLREDLDNNRELINVSVHNPHFLKLEMIVNPIDIIIVIDNLISNSQKNDAKQVDVKWRKNSNNNIEMSVKDDGIGIQDKLLKRIFDFGFTTTRGSGIGLYHVRDLLSKMKADISVCNEHEKGVEFIIEFRR